MKGARRLLGVLLATAVAGLVAVPAAQATIFERFRFDDAYSFQEEICGIELQIEGTVSGQVRIRTGKGKLATAFFGLFNTNYSETWTAANGRFVTVTGRSTFNEVKAVPLGGNLFRFTAVKAGQPFRLYDSEGVLVLATVASFAVRGLDAEGDDTPDAVLIEEFEPTFAARTRASSTRRSARWSSRC